MSWLRVFFIYLSVRVRGSVCVCDFAFFKAYAMHLILYIQIILSLASRFLHSRKQCLLFIQA